MSAEETAAVQAAQQTVPTPENVTAQASKPSGEEVSTDTSFKSIEQFRKEAPEIYNKFMESIQQSIVDDFKRRSKRIIDAMKKMRKENG